MNVVFHRGPIQKLWTMTNRGTAAKHIDRRLHLITSKNIETFSTMDRNSNFENIDDLSTEQLREEVQWMQEELKIRKMQRDENVRQLKLLKEKMTRTRTNGR